MSAQRPAAVLGATLRRAGAGAPLALAAGVLDASFAFFVIVVQAFLADRIHAGPAVPGYTLAIYGGTRVLFQAPGGLLARRVGARRLIAAGMAVGALALLALAGTRQTDQVYILVLIYGAATAFAWPAIYLRAGDLDQDYRGELFGLLTLCAMAGTAGGLGLGIFVGDRLPSRALITGTGAVLAAGAASFAGATLWQRRAPADALLPQAAPRHHLTRPAVPRLFVALALQGLGLAMLLPLLRQYAHQQLNLQMQHLLMLAVPGGLIGAVTLLPAGRLTDRLGRAPVTAIGAALVAAGIAVMAMVDTPPLFAVAIIPLAAGYAASAPALAAWIGDLTDDVGGSVGLALTVQGAAIAVGPALTGFLVARQGLTTPMLVAAGVWLLAALSVAVPLGREVVRRAEPVPPGKRLLITGGAGFIGHHTVQEALRHGWDVTVVDDLSAGRRERLPAAVHLIEQDITGPGLERVFARPFDGIIHLAAQTSVPRSMADPERDRAINLEGTARLLALAAASNPHCRFVFTSSAAVYGEPGADPVTEESPLRPVSYYGKHKAAAEERIRASGLPHAILRPANVYGPGQRTDADGGVIATFLDHVRRDLTLRVTGDGEQTRDFIYVRDVAAALVDALGWDESGVWNVSTKTETSLNTLITQISRVSGRPPHVTYVPERPGDIRRSCLDNERIVQTSHWRPRMALADGLAATYAIEGGPMPRSVAVVPAYNEEPTVAAVLDRLYDWVDELVVVDDGSTDGTRAAIQGWLPGHERAHLLCFDRNRGMSAAYYLAFSSLRDRMLAGELAADDLILTVDADGQHELGVLDELRRITVAQRLDALIVRRDLSTYPADKRFGNWLMSTWATLWAGQPLRDVESGYRIFRLGALADALSYYRGYKYSETVEVAVVLCRLGYKVRNDLVVPVPIYRSRTRLMDAAIDLAMIPAASRRIPRRRRRGAPVSRVLVTAMPLTLLFLTTRLIMRARKLMDVISDQL